MSQIQQNLVDRLRFRNRFISCEPKRVENCASAVVTCDHCGTRCGEGNGSWRRAVSQDCNNASKDGDDADGVVCAADHECFQANLCAACYSAYSVSFENVFQQEEIADSLSDDVAKQDKAITHCLKKITCFSIGFIVDRRPGACTLCQCIGDDYQHILLDQHRGFQCVCTGCITAFRYFRLPVMQRGKSSVLKSVIDLLYDKSEGSAKIARMTAEQVEQYAEELFKNK